jgi:hypothetical protein
MKADNETLRKEIRELADELAHDEAHEKVVPIVLRSIVALIAIHVVSVLGKEKAGQWLSNACNIALDTKTENEE